MDNVCHTLVGLALAESGLARRTARGTMTLAVAANLPDVDALLYVVGGGAAALAGRRGWTHGVLAMLVLPIALALAVWWWDRVAWLRARRRDPIAATNAGPSADVGALFALATVGVLSHALLDWTNSYGVRLLMPFGREWLYGDALFVVDPWLLVALLAGVLLARRRRRRGARASGGGGGPTGKRLGASAAAARGSGKGARPDVAYETRPARVALGVAALYVAAMVASGAVGRAVVERSARLAGAAPARRVMVAPVPLTPLRRHVVRDLGGAAGYELGTLSWLPQPRYAVTRRLPSGAGTPLAEAAARTREGREFLSWARFPVFVVDSARASGGDVVVRLMDARYVDGWRAGWASVRVLVPPGGG